MPTFLDDEDRGAFLGILDGLVDRSALEVHAFCLMRNHYHLLVRTPGGGIVPAERYRSRPRPAEIARRYGRSRGAVTLAARHLEAEARRDARLAAGLRRVRDVLEN